MRYCGGEQVSERKMKEMFGRITLIATVVLFEFHVRVEAEGVVNSFASKQREPMLDSPHMFNDS